MSERIVITGMGVVSPIGNSVEEFLSSLKAGVCGVDRITQFDTTDFDVKIAAEVKDFDASKWIEKKDARKMARFSQFAVAASAQALAQAGLLQPKAADAAPDSRATLSCDPERTGVVIGNGIGGYEVVDESFRKMLASGPKRMLPLTVPLMIGNEAAGNISMVYGTKGPALTQVTACASGTDALGQALDLLRVGRCDVILSGGTEAAITPFAVGGFQMLKALSTKRCDDPKRASRPFDADRDGFVMGEGAAMFVLETESHAKSRGAAILAELAGYGVSADAYHITSPDPSGDGGARAIKLALADAKVKPEEVQYYNAHGTSTEINDPTETKMIKNAFGDHAYKMKVSSTKGMTGHCIAAAGAIEALACVLAIREGFYPPTINLENPDPACDLDYVPNKAVSGTIDVAASGSLGFGGHNGVVVFKRYK